MIFSRAVDQAIIVKRPDQLRVDSYDVFGNLIHQLRVQKNHAEIHDFERGTARSEADVSAFLGEELGLDLSPDVLMTLLVGSVPLEARGDYLGITRKGGSILRGLRSQVLIDSGQGVPIRYVGYTQSNAIYEASFSDYREQSGRLFPYRIEVAVTDDNLFLPLGAAMVLSPDGTRMVYVTETDSGQTLAVRSLDQLEGTSLVSGNGSTQPYHPFFSPDGQWVGFATPEELKKMPITGGTPISLCKVNRSRGASWGPDNTIVFAPEPGGGLFTVSAAGGEPQPLTTLDPEKAEVAHRWPQVVPGGAVIFTSIPQGSGSADEGVIEAVSMETGERTVLHRGGSYGRWVPSGHLVYVRENTLFAMPFDVKKMRATGSPAPIVQGVTANSGNGGAQISFSGTGTLAYVSGEIGVPEYPVMMMDRNGVVSTLWEEPGTYANPKLSPDGRRLSLTVLRDGNWDVWVYDLERMVATRLTFDDGYDGDQVWSPDGEYLAFTSDRDGTENPYRKRADGSGEAERLAEIEHAFWASSWSPDGKWILGEVQSSSFDLWAIPADGSGEPVEYLATEFFERFPAISPNGRWIAYMSDESGREEIYVRPFPIAAGKWQVSDGGGDWPSWSRDGSELIYRTEDGMMSAKISTENASFRAGRPQPLASGGFSNGQIGVSVAGSIFSDYEIMPDGQSFIILQGGEGQTVQNHVTLVTNWFDVLRNTLPGS